MNKINQIFLISLLFYSCSNFKNDENNSGSTSADFKKTETTISFPGYWISEDYLSSINKFKSPRKAQDSSGDCLIIIPAKTLMKTMMIYNFHEGNPEMIVLKNKDKYQLYETVEDTIEKFVSDIDIISENKIKINNKNFIHINPFPHQLNNSEPLILEEILFKGKYKSRDGEIVEFKDNGQITGLKEYSFYKPAIDYFDEGLDVDQLGLGKSADHLENFGFKFHHDSLFIFQLKCIEYDSLNKRCGVVDFGQLKYSLVKEGN